MHHQASVVKVRGKNMRGKAMWSQNRWMHYGWRAFVRRRKKKCWRGEWWHSYFRRFPCQICKFVFDRETRSKKSGMFVFFSPPIFKGNVGRGFFLIGRQRRSGKKVFRGSPFSRSRNWVGGSSSVPRPIVKCQPVCKRREERKGPTETDKKKVSTHVFAKT